MTATGEARAEPTAFRKYAYAGAYHHALMREDEFYIAKIRRALALVGPGDLVIDVGCGDGVFVKYARDRGGRVVGIDPSLEGVTLAREMTGPGGLCVGSAHSLPLREAIADLIVMIDVVNYLRDCDDVIGEAARVLRAGGQLVIMSPYDVSLQAERAAFADSWQTRAWTEAELKAIAGRHFAEVQLSHIEKVVPRAGLGLLTRAARALGVARPLIAAARRLLGRRRAAAASVETGDGTVVLNSLSLPPILTGPREKLEFVLVARKAGAS